MNCKRSILLFLAMFLIAGCAILGHNTVPASSVDNVIVTPLERAKMQSALMATRYVEQDKDVAALESLVRSGKASVGQVKAYRVKRRMLIKVKPLIKAFDDIISDGGVPAVGRETEIFDILNNLAATAG